MRKRGFRSIFSLLLALMMVCTMLPTAAFAEGNVEPATEVAEQPTEQVTEQPTGQPEGGEAQQPTEKEAPQGEQPATPPQTYTVVYADGAENAIFEAKSFPGLTSGVPTPAFGDDPIRDGYTFLGWEPALAETVTGDVTYTAKWEAIQVELLPATNDSYGIAAYKGGHDTPQPSVDYDAEKFLGSGKPPMWVYVIYHANYPGATADNTWTVRYSIRPNGVYTMSGNDFLSYSQCGANGKGFNWAGYKSNDVWYSDKNCTTVVNSLKVKKDDIIHLYAGWTKSAPTTYNYSFTLNYDVNGGDESSKPVSQPYTAEPSTEVSLSHTFTISNVEPTREGYTFKGWSDTRDGTVSGLTEITLTATKDAPNATKTLYAVWEKNAPNGPTNEEVTKLLGQVKVRCTTNAGHKDQSYDLNYRLTSMEPDGNGYTCNVYVEADEYVTKYNKDYPNTDHVLADGENRIRSFVLRNDNNGEGWYISEGNNLLPIVFNVKCETEEPTPPSVPTDEEIAKALEGKVNVVVSCVTENSGHAPKRYSLFAYVNDLTKAEGITANGDGTYSYTVSFLASNFVEMYSKSTGIGVNHTLVLAQGEADLREVTLTWWDSTLGWTATTQDINVNAMCKETPPTDEPEAPDVNDLLKDKWVGIHCKNIPTHDRGFEWVDNSYATKEEGVVSDGKGGYTYTVTILPNAYIAACNAWIPKMPHTLVGPESVDVTLTWNKETKQWKAPEGETIAMFTFTCKTVTPSGPEKPTENELANIKMVTVDCINKNVNHPDEDYGLIEGSYSGPTDPVADENGVYHCYIDVNGEKYVAEYSKKHGDHIYTYADTAIQRIFLTATKIDNGYVWSADNKIVFQAMCETKVVPPTPPTDEDLKNLDVPSVDVICVTKGQPHSASYGLIKDSYDIGEVTSNENGDYTCDITVHAEKYVLESNRLYGVHALAERESNTKILTLKYENGKWGTGREHVTFNVECVEFVPTEADLAGIRVFVQCTNSSATHGDKRKEYGLIDGYYFVKTPTFDKDSHVYRCTVNVNGDSYVEQYGKDVGNVEHTWAPADTIFKYAYLVATWTGDGYVWSVDKEGATVEFEARCETVPPAQTFTVTYKDGVAGKAFRDQSYTVPSGSATPAFNGTPYLAGYVFTGWTPDVAATVTANATYIASWKLDTNNNGKPDDEEERYTVTYTDGAGGKAFVSQVYTGLLSGTSTPKFNGTPVRAGYYFTGWSPQLSATVTGNVTYTATWTKAYGGLDNVPKTGDNGLTLALSALLLFSFCGATACAVSTKKRG